MTRLEKLPADLKYTFHSYCDSIFGYIWKCFVFFDHLSINKK